MSPGPFATLAARRARLAAARLHLLVTPAVCRLPAREVARLALVGGADVLQVRDKDGDDDAVLALAHEIRPLCRRYGALLIVNDRPALAVRAGADGVHVGQDDAPMAEARAEVGADLLVGVSTHDEPELAAALEDGADYVGVGAVFPTATKGRPVPVGSPVALAPLAARAEAAGVPAFGIGGITVTNAAEVVDAGFRRMAVCGAVCTTDDPARAARDLVAILSRPA